MIYASSAVSSASNIVTGIRIYKVAAFTEGIGSTSSFAYQTSDHLDLSLGLMLDDHN